MCDIDDEKDNEDDENMNMNRAGSTQAMGDVNSGGDDGSSDNDSIQIGDGSNEAADDAQHDLSGMSSAVARVCQYIIHNNINTILIRIIHNTGRGCQY